MTPQANISVTIIVPAFNESQQIAYTVRILKNYLEHHSIIHDLIIVDDGSTDDTSHVTRLVAGQWPNVIVLSTGTNRGKGFAVRQGMLKSTRDVALFMDADLSTPPEEILVALREIEKGFDVVIGTRNTEASKIVVRQPRLREWLGGSYTWLANQVTNAGVTDFTCGFKAFRLSAAKEIFERQLLDSWSFDAEVLFLTRKFGFRLSEIPIEWRNNPKTRVRLARDVFVSLFGLILIRVNDSFRRYKRIHTRVASDG